MGGVEGTKGKGKFHLLKLSWVGGGSCMHIVMNPHPREAKDEGGGEGKVALYRTMNSLTCVNDSCISILYM